MAGMGSLCAPGAAVGVVLVLCLGDIHSTPSGPRRGRGEAGSTDVDPEQYLAKYGYLEVDQLQHTRNLRHTWKHAIRSFQRFNHLKVNGRLSRRAVTIMKQPRCGVPDIDTTLGSSDRKHRHKRALLTGFKKAVNSVYGLKWRSNQLRWKMSRYTSRLTAEQQLATLKRVFGIWASQANLTVVHSSSDADIEVVFGRGSHGDGNQYAFDGSGPQLAHAFGPGDAAVAGDIHFDDDERWTLDDNDPTSKDLFVVALHEAGHALGMPHSRDRKAVMYAHYKGYDPSLSLSYDDVRKLQTFYGARPVPAPSVSTSTAAAIAPTSTPEPTTCNMPFDDVIYGPGTQGYVLSGRHVYSLKGRGEEGAALDRGPYRLRRVLKGSPIHISAAVYVAEKKRLYVFKGYRVWRYTRFRLDRGYPTRPSPYPPERPVAALGERDYRGKTKIYVFGKRYVWVYDQDRDSREGSYLWIRTFWRGLPSPIDAAVQWGDGNVYFFRKNKYYRLSKYYRAIMAGYPKVKDVTWLSSTCWKK
ncbi:matrix metalloproteinase-19-like [Haliotis cracherodii]|uniref:matrix metalloproteinase-19-like n=1 Tax=Haliotis cracherodii TaxID=6455 RepID=UPI0039E8F4C9